MLHLAGLFLVFLFGCEPVEFDVATDTVLTENPDAADAQWLDLPPDYRSVGYETYGPKLSGLSASTEVWPVTRRWYEVSTEAGPAWSANSGLTWDQKYAAWIDAMGPTPGDDGYMTVELITPWGKKLPSPRLECAEMGMFLRVTFAAWYKLPFFMTGWSSTNGYLYFGNFGQVNSEGVRISGSPNYATSYQDYTASMAGQTDAYIVANWPHDTTLAARYLTSQKDDFNTFLGPNKYAGAYFDEVHLNKRVGYFLMTLLVNFGSMHIADARNAWDLEPKAMRPGDLLVERWQAQGIGHVMVLKEVTHLSGGNLDPEIMFGSMPRIQPVWYSAAIAKSYFVSQYSGGPELDSTGTPYSRYHGGLKRWRTPIQQGGRWVNIVPTSDRADYIDDDDYAKLEARIATLEQILGNLTPTERKEAILERIRIARDTLSRHPSSCANRTRREEAFDELYVLMQAEWGWSRDRVDREYRDPDDYIFAELEYRLSKTCCWNSTTEEMYAIITEYNDDLVQDALAAGQCVEPVVFKARGGGGYEPFATYAAQTGRASQWKAWTADESCPPAGTSEDVEVSTPWTDFCDIAADLYGTGTCTGGMQSWYRDGDGDGYGAGSPTQACDRPTGMVANATDCDDGDQYIYPSGWEYCDGEDNDCDGTKDEGCDAGGDDTGSGGGSSPDCGGCGRPANAPFSYVGYMGLLVIAARRRRA